MHKAERDHAMARLSPADRDHFRRLIQDMRTQATASSGHRSTARQVLAAQGGTVSPALRAALAAAGGPDLWQLYVTPLPGPGRAPGGHLSPLP